MIPKIGRELLIVLFAVSVSLNVLAAENRMANPATRNDVSFLPFAAQPLHGFGGRINSFQSTNLNQKFSFNLILSNANIWAPPAWALIPQNETTAQYLAEFPWHKRDSVYQAMPHQHDSIFFEADGIVRNITLNGNVSISRKLKLHTTIRAMQLLANPALNPLVSDNNIENFHSKVLQQEDPFGRKQFALNSAHILFVDEDGKSLEVNKAQVVLQGIDNTLKYAINSDRSNTSLFGLLHTTLNTSRFNRSLALGLSAMGYHRILLNKKSSVGIGVGAGVMKSNVISGAKNVVIQTAKQLISMQSQLAFVTKIARSNTLKITLAFDYLSAYRNQKEYDSVVLSKAVQTSSFWHRGLSHQYENTQRCTLALTYGFNRKSITFFMMEDLKVDNLPDLQTGFIFSF